MFDEINAANSAEDQAMQASKHHDGLYYFPLPQGSKLSDRDIYCVNHENITQVHLTFKQSHRRR